MSSTPCRHGTCGNWTTSPTGKCYAHEGSPDLDAKPRLRSRIGRTPKNDRDFGIPVTAVRDRLEDDSTPSLLPRGGSRRASLDARPPFMRAEQEEIIDRIETISRERGVDRRPTGAIRRDEDGREFPELVYGNAYQAAATSLTHLQFHPDRWEVRRGKNRDDYPDRDRGVGRLLASGSYEDGFVDKATAAFARGAHLGSSPNAFLRRAFTRFWVR